MPRVRIYEMVMGRMRRSPPTVLHITDVDIDMGDIRTPRSAIDSERRRITSDDETNVCGFEKSDVAAFRTKCTSHHPDDVVSAWCGIVGGDPATPFLRALRQVLMHFALVSVQQIACGQVGAGGEFVQTTIVHRSTEGGALHYPATTDLVPFDVDTARFAQPLPRACVVWVAPGKMHESDGAKLQSALTTLKLRVNLRFPTIVRLYTHLTQRGVRLALIEQRPHALRSASCGGAEDACPVCIDALDTDVSACVMACGHIIHASCVEMLMMKRAGAHEDTPAACPICRTKIY